MNTKKTNKKNTEKRKNKAVILDRDGTLNVDSGYTHKVEDFQFHDGVIEGLKLLKGFKFFIITNQSGINRGYYKEEHMREFNNHLIKELKKHSIRIEKVYFCPHTPEENCSCRKPSIKFIKEAEKEFNIDLKSSFVIGDHDYDIKMGKDAGCKSIYLLTGHGEKHKNEIKIKPDFIANNFLEAAKWILNQK